MTILRRHFGLLVVRYVDDFLVVSPESSGVAARRVLEEVTDLFGIQLDPAKTVGPAIILVFLGLQVDVCLHGRRGMHGLPTEFVIQVPPNKRANYSSLIQKALDAWALSGGEASRLAGKLAFASTATFGRVGRAMLRPLYARARGASRDVFGYRLETALRW